MHKLVPLSQIDPNPFRDMDRYEIKDEKIDALMASMDRTGFWDNVVARKVGDRWQLAYGHHRWLTFIKKYGKNAEMPLIPREISDADMLRIMADENAREWGASAAYEQETIRAVVEAFAAGKIELNEVPAKTKKQYIRYAPSFRRGSVSGSETHPYTDESVASFLGWWKDGKSGQVSSHVRNALNVLEAMEKKLVSEDDLEGLTTDQADEVAQGASRIQKSFEDLAEGAATEEHAEELRSRGRKKARASAKRATKKIKRQKKKGRGYGVRDIQDDMADDRAIPDGQKVPPMVGQFCETFAKQLAAILGAKDKRWKKINKLIALQEDIAPEVLEPVAVALDRLAERCQALAGSLRGEPAKLTGR